MYNPNFVLIFQLFYFWDYFFAYLLNQALSKIACNRLQKEMVEWQDNPPVGFKHKVTDNLPRFSLFSFPIVLTLSLSLNIYIQMFVKILWIYLVINYCLFHCFKDGLLKSTEPRGPFTPMKLISFKLIFLSITQWRHHRWIITSHFCDFLILWLH